MIYKMPDYGPTTQRMRFAPVGRSVFDGKSIAIDPVIHLDELKKELVARRYRQRTIKQ